MTLDLIRELWPDINRLLFLFLIVWGLRGCFLAIAYGKRREMR